MLNSEFMMNLLSYRGVEVQNNGSAVREKGYKTFEGINNE